MLSADVYDLASVTIPYGATNIGFGAFLGCESLTNAVIPESVTSIGQGAFGVTGLISVTIPASVTEFGDGAFEVGDSLTNLIIEPGITSFGANNVFAANPYLTALTIPATVTNLEEGTFAGCTALTQVLFLGNAPLVDDSVFKDSELYGFHDDFTSNVLSPRQPIICLAQPVGTNSCLTR